MIEILRSDEVVGRVEEHDRAVGWVLGVPRVLPEEVRPAACDRRRPQVLLRLYRPGSGEVEQHRRAIGAEVRAQIHESFRFVRQVDDHGQITGRDVRDVEVADLDGARESALEEDRLVVDPRRPVAIESYEA